MERTETDDTSTFHITDQTEWPNCTVKRKALSGEIEVVYHLATADDYYDQPALNRVDFRDRSRATCKGTKNLSPNRARKWRDKRRRAKQQRKQQR